MDVVFLVAGAGCLAPVVGARMLWLAPYRAGWVPYLSNIFTTTLLKKLRLRRPVSEMLLVLASLALLALGGAGVAWLLAVAVAVAILEASCRQTERRILVHPYTIPGARSSDPAGGPSPREGAPAVPGPTAYPDLTLNLVGPFVRRMPVYDLGSLPPGSRLELTLVVGNHTFVPTQTPIRIEVTAGAELEGEALEETTLPRLGPGGVHEWRGCWRVRGTAGIGRLDLDVSWGPVRRRLTVRFQAVAGDPGATIRSAEIRRYPGGCRSAFAWRGDMDLYDEATLQSIEGLEAVFGLAARYRMPQTLYLSTRLSLDEAAARDFGEHYGIDRGAGRIPDFVEWMNRNVELRASCAYPYSSSRRFVAELGNHGHLHFGTDTAAARENGWRRRSRMGAGRYPWLSEETGSFAEQRDNALEASRLCEERFGFRPKSWAMPDRTNDESTARAMEAAGCEVLSDSDVRTVHNVLLQPAPHHPPGTRAVELTKRFPGDPLDVFDVAMNVFWFHRAHRLGIPVVFMCHQHLRRYESEGCPRFTEYLLRYVLERFHGDLHVDTVFGIGKYWREVLSPQTRSVTVRWEGREIVVVNGSDEGFADLPVDIELSDGRRRTSLVSVPAGGEARLDGLA
jgi:hypothetical protein